MPATFQCGACHATWSSDRQPTECPHCKSRAVERWGPSAPAVEEHYRAPGVPLDGSPVSSTSFSLGYWLGLFGTIAGFALLVWAGFRNADAARNRGGNPNGDDFDLLAVVGLLVFTASSIAYTVASIASFVKLYRGWKVIQPLRAIDREEADMPTPGAAVGLLFVPFYNLYWFFEAYSGLAVRANKYMRRSKVDARPMSEGLARTYCILIICAFVPLLNFLLLPVILVIYYLVILDIDRMRSEVQAWQVSGSRGGYVNSLADL